MSKKRFAKLLLCLLLAVSVLFTSCSNSGGAKNGSTPTSSKSSGGKMTDVGTPRNQTFIVDMLDGKQANPSLMNPYLPGCVSLSAGLHQLVYGHLWEVDTMKGKQYGDLAETMLQPLDDTNTKFKFSVRKGIKWSDGVDFTADDIVFTSDMILKTKSFGFNGYYAGIVKNMKALDKYTVEVDTVQPETKLEQKLGVVIWGQSFRPVPKHIWEKEDPEKFKYSNPLSVGPYVLKSVDPQGYWFLYEKRKDWQNSDVGVINGEEPGPQYILFKSFGTEEKRVMAMANNDIDVLQDITPESMDILLKKNKNVTAWYKNFPYADMNDPCERGIEFNTSKPPLNNVDVRWALALATDIKSVSMATFGGMLRVSPIQVPPIDVLQQIYHKPMVNWLKTFQLSDCYKPFDDSYASSMVSELKQQGIEGLPSEDKAIDTFGVGWWKYDPVEATKLLTKAGLKKQGDKWMLSDGKPFQITVNAPANFEVESGRLAFAVVDSWKKFGIDAVVQQMDSATFGESEATGAFQAGSYWPSCGLLPDTTSNMYGWHEKYIVPNGQRAPSNAARWKNDTVSKLLDELSSMKADDPQIVPKITQVNQEFVKELPFLPMFGTSKFVPVNTYYWSGFQTSDNPFEGPWWWWSQFKFYTPHFKPTGK